MGKAAVNQPERLVTDSTGVRWKLKEATVWQADGSAKRSLIAEHERGFRRIWDFPEQWLTLGDEELVALVLKPAGRRDAPGVSLPTKR